MDFQLKSPAFEWEGVIPKKYTCDGENISPPMEWEDAPEGTACFVLICQDPDARGQVLAHWLLYNLPAELSALPENVPAGGELPWGGMQGENDMGEVRYSGPCPPPGSTHHYYFRMYAVDRQLELSAGAKIQEVLDQIRNHTLASSELMGLYTRF